MPCELSLYLLDMKKEKIIVGLSGGVDSSVAALLLKQQGYEVEGLFMKNWDEQVEDGSCMWEADVEDAMHVCEVLGIHLNTVDLAEDYWDQVFSHFINEYRNGRTPNPDVLCNQEIKFNTFMSLALAQGADRIATGHYARIKYEQGRYRLLKGLDENKDQSYFLCRLGQEQLPKSLFPIGAMRKPDVRKLARDHGLITHDKKDSTGICFVGERDFREFLSRYIPKQPGAILSPEGDLLGHHDGVFYYTLGQRQGLGIGGVRGQGEDPWYVVGKDIHNNTLYAAQGHNHPLLFSKGLLTHSMHWVSGQSPATAFRCMAKTRYRQPDQSCTVEVGETSECRVTFDTDQRAVTPGQYIVLYDGAVCLGGGVIESTWQAKKIPQPA